MRYVLDFAIDVTGALLVVLLLLLAFLGFCNLMGWVS